jgi:hypothetical protein
VAAVLPLYALAEELHRPAVLQSQAEKPVASDRVADTSCLRGHIKACQLQSIAEHDLAVIIASEGERALSLQPR